MSLPKGKVKKNLDDGCGVGILVSEETACSKDRDEGTAMEVSWEKAEVSCPNCLEILVLRPGLEEIWCQRCEVGYDVMESRNPRDPERTVLVLSKKREMPGRA
jgi:hypothetical protein